MDRDNPLDNYTHQGISLGFKSLTQNLSKKQKVVIVVLMQIILVIILASIVVVNTSQPRNHISTVDNDDILKNIPSKEIELYEQGLWSIIEETVDGADKSMIKDAVIREGSYIDETDENQNDSSGSHQVSFIVDIDSIQQSYKVVLGWSRDQYNPPIIDCLPASEAKYPDSICYGTYRNTHDLSLYFPYTIYAPQSNGANDVLITGEEYEHWIKVDITNCRPDELKKQAQDYLDSLPIDLTQYNIEYEISDPDGGYFDGLSESEFDAANKRCGYE